MILFVYTVHTQYSTTFVCMQVRVVTSIEDRKRILQSCHSDPTSGHFGTTKTWRRVAERFYWKGMIDDVKELVSLPVMNHTGMACCNLIRVQLCITYSMHINTTIIIL